MDVLKINLLEPLTRALSKPKMRLIIGKQYVSTFQCAILTYWLGFMIKGFMIVSRYVLYVVIINIWHKVSCLRLNSFIRRYMA